MPMINCYVDDDLLRFLLKTADDKARSVQGLAEAAIENAAIEAGYRRPQEHWTTEFQRATGGN